MKRKQTAVTGLIVALGSLAVAFGVEAGTVEQYSAIATTVVSSIFTIYEIVKK